MTNDNDCDNNTGALAAMGVLLAILLIGLIVSLVVNVWQFLKRKR